MGDQDEADEADNNWFDTGEAVRADQVDDGEQQRFFMKVDTERTLLFLDGNTDTIGSNTTDKERFNRPYSAPFAVFEYQIPTEGPEGTNWRNWETSLRGRRDSHGQPMRDVVRDLAPSLKPYYVGFFTVLDLTGIERLEALLEKGNPIQGTRKYMLPAKRSTLQMLKRRSEKRDGLRGCVFDVARSGDKSPNVGDDYQFVARVSDAKLERLFPDDYKPFEYHKLLKPRSEDEIKALVGKLAKVTKFGDSGGRGGGRGGDRGRSGGGAAGGRGRDGPDDSGRQDRARRRRDEDDTTGNNIQY